MDGTEWFADLDYDASGKLIITKYVSVLPSDQALLLTFFICSESMTLSRSRRSANG